MSKKKLGLSERMKTDPRLRARVLANPGLRSKIPTSQLPQSLQQARLLAQRKARYASDPSMVTEQKTQADLDREAKAAADVRYGQDERDMQDVINASPQQQANIAAASADYQKRNDEIAQRLGEVNSQVQGVVQTAKASDMARDALLRSEVQDQQAKDSALRGAPIDSSLTDLAAKASQGRQSALDTYGVQQGIQHASAQDLLGRHALSAKTEFNDYGLKEQNRLRDTIRKRGLLAREKGDYQTKYGAEARQAERDQLNARSAIALNQTEAQQKAEAEAAGQQLDALKFSSDQSLKRSRLKLDAGRLNETARHNQTAEQIAASKGSGSRAKGKSPWLAPAGQNSEVEKIKKALAYVKQHQGYNAWKNDYDKLRAGGKDGAGETVPAFGDTATNAAMDLARYGYLTPANVKRLHDKGIKVGGNFKTGKPPKAKAKKKHVGGSFNAGTK